jgi:hypothetical protein
MNERLKELAEQANIFREFAITGLWLADDAEFELFAELIRQDEREANAKLAEITCCKCMDTAKAIRARKEQV